MWSEAQKFERLSVIVPIFARRLHRPSHANVRRPPSDLRTTNGLVSNLDDPASRAMSFATARRNGGPDSRHRRRVSSGTVVNGLMYILATVAILNISGGNDSIHQQTWVSENVPLLARLLSASSPAVNGSPPCMGRLKSSTNFMVLPLYMPMAIGGDWPTPTSPHPGRRPPIT